MKINIWESSYNTKNNGNKNKESKHKVSNNYNKINWIQVSCRERKINKNVQ